jgi:hypothetical protein
MLRHLKKIFFFIGLAGKTSGVYTKTFKFGWQK